ncbi:hypothetical protein B1B00_17775 [Bacillus sp. DSM 27956]|nr:hypothetical protein B1B00_17775 [Bacillus sp. DSM 27956]
MIFPPLFSKDDDAYIFNLAACAPLSKNMFTYYTCNNCANFQITTKTLVENLISPKLWTKPPISHEMFTIFLKNKIVRKSGLFSTFPDYLTSL